MIVFIIFGDRVCKNPQSCSSAQPHEKRPYSDSGGLYAGWMRYIGSDQKQSAKMGIYQIADFYENGQVSDSVTA